LRVARALEDLGQIRLALRDGEIKWTTARELTRVATRYTEGEWLAAVKGMTARQVEHLVGGHQVGDLPSDPPDERLRRQVLRVELSADSMATFREAVAKLRKQGLDEDGAYLEMARQVLQGPSDPGRARTRSSSSSAIRARGRGSSPTASSSLSSPPSWKRPVVTSTT
jgi:hypothetical protein